MDEGDVQEDVTATKGKPAQYMNQSVFSMITAAGSKVDFNARFENESSDSEEEDEASKVEHQIDGHISDTPPQQYAEQRREELVGRAKSAKRHGKLLEHSILRSLPKLTPRTKKEKYYMSQSTVLPSAQGSSVLQRSITPRDAPVMSRMLEAEARMSSSTILSKEEQYKSDSSSQNDGATGPSRPTSLVARLRDIFGFENPEEVISGNSLKVARPALC